MADIVVDGLDDALLARLKRRAEEKSVSVEQLVRDILTEKAREAPRDPVKPSKAEIWAEADRIRKKIGKVSGDSTQIIREWRDNDEPHR